MVKLKQKISGEVSLSLEGPDVLSYSGEHVAALKKRGARCLQALKRFLWVFLLSLSLNTISYSKLKPHDDTPAPIHFYSRTFQYVGVDLHAAILGGGQQSRAALTYLPVLGSIAFFFFCWSWLYPGRPY